MGLPLGEGRRAGVELLAEAPLQALAGLFADRKNPLAVREESLVAVMKADPAGVMEQVRAVAAEEWSAVDQRTLEMTARVVAGAGWASAGRPPSRRKWR